MKKLGLYIFLLFISFGSIQAQSLIEIVSYTFESTDTCLFQASSGMGNSLSFQTDEMECECGVKGDAIVFDGFDEVILGGGIKDLFRKQDFTVSFYFKVFDQGFQGRQALLSNQDTCDNKNVFAISYIPINRTLEVFLIEDADNEASITAPLPENSCWYHIVVTRANNITRLYANGELLRSQNSTTGERVDLENDANAIRVGTAMCITNWGFEGLMDELQFWQGAMSAQQVKNLYLSPEKIGNGKFSLGTKDTTIFLGTSVNAFITSKCPEVDIQWTPGDGIPDDQENISTPVITPTQTTTYAATFSDDYCSSTDSLTIVVIDPNDLDCTELFLPKAFTPNGDGLNDVYGISNAVVITELISFDIFDRWGNLVFSSTDPNAKWDGTYRGKPVNSNVFLYKVQYKCKDEELARTGSITIMR